MKCYIVSCKKWDTEGCSGHQGKLIGKMKKRRKGSYVVLVYVMSGQRVARVHEGKSERSSRGRNELARKELICKRYPGDKRLQISRWGILAYLLECYIFRVGKNFRGHLVQTISKKQDQSPLGAPECPSAPSPELTEEQVTGTRDAALPLTTSFWHPHCELITLSVDVHILWTQSQCIRSHYQQHFSDSSPEKWDIITKSGMLTYF